MTLEFRLRVLVTISEEGNDRFPPFLLCLEAVVPDARSFSDAIRKVEGATAQASLSDQERKCERQFEFGALSPPKSALAQCNRGNNRHSYALITVPLFLVRKKTEQKKKKRWH